MLISIGPKINDHYYKKLMFLKPMQFIFLHFEAILFYFTVNNSRAAKRNSNASFNSTLPLKIYLNQNSIQNPDVAKTTKNPVQKEKDLLICPEEKQAPFQLFPQYCSKVGI
jgi:hypothetical protein